MASEKTKATTHFDQQERLKGGGLFEGRKRVFEASTIGNAIAFERDDCEETINGSGLYSNLKNMMIGWDRIAGMGVRVSETLAFSMGSERNGLNRI
jgi:hypothetical protein